MPSRPLIIVDISAPGLDGMLKEFGSETLAPRRIFSRFDGNEFDYQFVERTGDAQQPFRIADLTGYTIQSALGATDSAPTSGTFDIAYQSVSVGSTGLAFDITAAALETALNANAQISGAGSVDVFQFGSSYKVIWRTFGAKDLLTSAADALQPESYASITRTVVGAVATYEVQWIKLSQKPLGYTNVFVAGSVGSAPVSVLQAGTATAAEIQRISLNLPSYAGSIVVNIATRQQITVACVADVAGSLDETGIIVQDAAGTVGIWMDHGGGGTAPAEILACTRQIAITTTANDMSGANIATQWQSVVDADSQFIATRVGNVVTIRQASQGARIDPTDVGTGFTFETTQGGIVASSSIPTSATAAEMAHALGSVVNVLKSGPYQWDIIFRAPGDQDLVTVSAEALFQTIYTASLGLSNNQTFARFETEDSDTEFITEPWEISITPPGALPITVYRQDHDIYRDVITNDVEASTPLPTSITALRTGNMVWVDQINGSDAGAGIGLRGRMDRPFLTCEAALAAALNGDTIYVFPGQYTTATSLAKHGVNWYLEGGAQISMDSDSNVGIFDDGGTEMTFSVKGEGDLFRTNTGSSAGSAVIRASHVSSAIFVEVRDIISDDVADNGHFVIDAVNGELIVNFQRLICTGPPSQQGGIWWTNGRLHVSGKQISSEGYGAYGDVDATPTGDCYIRVDEITGASSSVYMIGSNADAAMWVDALILRGAITGGGGKLYVDFQKAFGLILQVAGLLYLDGFKVSAVANGTSGSPSLLIASGGEGFLNIDHWDPAGFTGQTLKQTGGTVHLAGGYLTTSTAAGIEITTGTMHLGLNRVDASANSGTNPVIMSGGTLVLDGVYLKSQGARDTVETGAAALTIYSNHATGNNDVDSAATIVGTFALAALP